MTNFKYGDGEKMKTGSGENTNAEIEYNYEFQLENEISVGGQIRSSIREKSRLSDSKVKLVRVELVERDYRILEFILEMKFAGCGQVFEKFFKKVKGGVEAAASQEWARKRLRQLHHAGFLRSCVSITGGANVFTASYKAYFALAQVYAHRSFPKPTGGLDTRTFLHDREMLLLRLKFERDGGEVNWISDRSLRQGFGERFGLYGIHVPDGLMLESPGNWAGIELEIASKSRERYEDKVARYVKLIRANREKPDGIRKVIYFCMRPQVFDALTKECRPYGDMFEVKSAKPTHFALGTETRNSFGGVA
ncbi:hypothetical protein BH10BDE1_BH10BDE1_23540 [soil metagenome]